MNKLHRIIFLGSFSFGISKGKNKWDPLCDKCEHRLHKDILHITGHFVGGACKSLLCMQPSRLYGSGILYLLHSAGVIQLQLGNDTPRLQCSSGPLHVVNTTGFCSCKSHYHLHHLDRGKVQSSHANNS